MTVVHKRMLWGSALVMFVVMSSVVLRFSAAAFTATADVPGNNWDTGTVVLDHDGDGSAMFDAAGLVPGQQVQRCIVVTYEGSVDGRVRLYGADLTETNDLADDLELTVEHGSGGSFGDCAGFTAAGTVFPTASLRSFSTAHTDHATGADTWAPLGGAVTSRSYRLTVELADDSTKQASQASYRFVWEAQS